MSEPTDEFLKVMEEVAARLLQMEPGERELALQLLEKELRGGGEYCHDPKHDVPCRKPCGACEDECEPGGPNA